MSSVWLVSNLNSLKLSFFRNCDSSVTVRNGTEAFDFFFLNRRGLYLAGCNNGDWRARSIVLDFHSLRIRCRKDICNIPDKI